MVQRLVVMMAVALAAVSLAWGCADEDRDKETPGFSPGPNPAGSCNFKAQGTCDEYAEAQATPATAQSCATAGGEWSSGKCPFETRTGVCSAISAATRSYSYTLAAATTLQAGCPAGKFFMIKPAEMPMAMPPAMPEAMPPDEDAGP